MKLYFLILLLAASNLYSQYDIPRQTIVPLAVDKVRVDMTTIQSKAREYGETIVQVNKQSLSKPTTTASINDDERLKKYFLDNNVSLDDANLIYELFSSENISYLKSIKVSLEEAIVQTDKYMKKYAPIKFNCTPVSKIMVYGEKHTEHGDDKLKDTLTIEDQITNSFIYGFEGRLFTKEPIKTYFLNLIPPEYQNVPIKKLGLDPDRQVMGFDTSPERSRLIKLFMTDKEGVERPYKDFANNNKSVFGIESEWQFAVTALPMFIYFVNSGYYNRGVNNLVDDFVHMVNDNKTMNQIWMEMEQEKFGSKIPAEIKNDLNILDELISLQRRGSSLDASKIAEIDTVMFNKLLAHLLEISYEHFFVINKEHYFIPSYVKRLYHDLVLIKDYGAASTNLEIFTDFVVLDWRNIDIANNISKLYCGYANPRKQTLLIHIGYKHLKGLKLLLEHFAPNIEVELVSPYL